MSIASLEIVPRSNTKFFAALFAPSHTFANMFAGKLPWFRYPVEGSFNQTFGGPLHPTERPLWKDEPRYSFGAQFVSMNFPLERASCSNCKQFFPGYGFDFNYRLAKYAYFDSVAKRDTARRPKREKDDKAWQKKQKRKVCIFCKDRVDYVDYKDVITLRKFVSERGKIRARRVTGNCVQHQRDVATAVKSAREMALLPYSTR